MAQDNSSRVTEFILLGLSNTRELQLLFFTLILLAYTMVLLGNLLIIVTVRTDPKLSSPMYFLLCNLSFLDICYTSVTVPRVVVALLSGHRAIAFEGCMAQLFFLHFVGSSEMFLLTVMAFDRYMAISRPLHYTAIMARGACWALVAACWAGGFIHSTVQTVLMLQLPFCGPNTINSYFCDVPPIIRLACADTALTEWLMASNSGLISLGCFLVLVASYALILAKVRARVSQGNWKALSTCASHVMAVTLFFMPCIFTYLRPAGTLPTSKVVSMLYGMLTPLLNPIIYSLRNKEVKCALKRVISQAAACPLTASSL
ncbi:unnamed protein product [Coccothraustes coccothraustes]